MPDSMGMNITHHIPAAFLVGSLISVASPAQAGEAGVGSVELIPFPEDGQISGELIRSYDGRPHLFNHRSSLDDAHLVYQYRNNEWVLIRKDVRAPSGLRAQSVTPDASRVVLSNYRRIDIIEGEVVMTLPRDWVYTDQYGRVRGTDGEVEGGNISADGQVVAMAGRARDTGEYDSLIWTGENELINISDGLPRGEISYFAGLPSADGSVVVFPSSFRGTHNNFRQMWSYIGDVWVWEDSVVVQIPDLDPGYDVLMRLINISGNGDVVVGSADGRWKSLGAPNEPLTDQSNGIVIGPKMAWIWTRATGTQEITDPRFSEMSLSSVDYDGSMVIGSGTLVDGGEASFIRFRDGRVLLIDDLLYALNISIEADSYAIRMISHDGTKLIGSALVDGKRHALIVTIPDLTP